MAPPLSPGARRRPIPTKRSKKPGVKFRSFGVDVNAGYGPDQPKFFFGSVIRIIRTNAIKGRAMFAPFPSANKQPEAPMNDDQNNNPPLPPSGNQVVASTTYTNADQNNNSPNGNQTGSPLLSLFDVLVDEYAHQVKTHGLKPLYPDGAAIPANDAAKRKLAAEEMREQAENERNKVKAKYPLLQDEKERGLSNNEELVKDLDRQVNEELVKDFYKRLHASSVKRAAICFSGGGIRSATFGLGVLQGLARHVNLDRFHYLSTVSGGGYLGSWFSAWAHRRGMEEVQKGLQGNHGEKGENHDENGENRKYQSRLSPEPEPILHLRRYSNYMSPKLGLLSADMWTLVGIYLRNLFLNWLVLIPLMVAALSLPRLWTSALAWENPDGRVVNDVFWGGFLLGVISITYIVINRPSLADLRLREWIRALLQKLRSEGSFRICGLGFLVATAIASAFYWSWIHRVKSPVWLSLFGFEPRKYFDHQKPWGFIAFGIALHLLGLSTGHILCQIFAARIFKWKRYFSWLLDFFFGAVAGAIGGLCLWMIARAFPTPVIANQDSLTAALYACSAPPLFLLAFLVAAAVFMGLASYHTSDADREWVARAGGWTFIAIAVWTIVNGLVIFGPVGLIWLWENGYPYTLASLASTWIGSGVITLLGGRAGATSAKKAEDEKTKKSGLPVKLLELAVPFAAAIFALIFIAALSLGTTALIGWIYKVMMQGELATTPLWKWHLHALFQTPFWLALVTPLIFGAIGLLMGLFVNVNKFSLHSAYRDRLIRAYLGASRSANERRPNPFTGMDEQDNLQMHDLIRPVFSRDNFVNLDELIKGLAHSQTHRDRFIRSNLPQRTQELLKEYNKYVKENPNPPNDKIDGIKNEARRDLIDSFNRIIHGPPLHEDGAFRIIRKELQKDGKFSDIQKLINDQPEVPLSLAGWLPRQFWPRVPVEKLRINAMLLEAAFRPLIKLVPEELYEARPLHVVNMALNLVKDEELAWQDRKAQSFTVSPLHAGSLFDVGYRRSKNYAIGRKQSSAITLGTSLAISGAAASPNMGYHSSPIVTFLMALFNVRLGWWLGNPGQAGAATHSKPGPVIASRPLIAETLGRTDNDHPYIYLSDGGHFENLGLYEMVLRRCHFIIVSDGSQDEGFDFESLGNAMSKIRTDLGIRITFDSIPISPREKKIPTFVKDHQEEKGKKYCAVGRIHYSDVDGGKPAELDGFLLYIKPAIYGAEPADVQNYARANPAFPHESTGDQMYSETQFESYRALGFHEVLKIRDSESKIELKEMFRQVYKDYLGEEIPRELRDE